MPLLLTAAPRMLEPGVAAGLFLLLLVAAGCDRPGGTIAPPEGIRFEVTVPGGLADGTKMFVAGTFNDWEPGDPAYQLREKNDTTYVITLPDVLAAEHEFKFTLGTWERVEVDRSGADVGNRTIVVPSDRGITYTSRVHGWRSTSDSWPLPNSTATPSVSIMDPVFPMDPLDRTRRVWVYLPPDYNASEKSYPVLYMHDGQNLFDAATSYAGEWGVDETLDSLHAEGHPGLIVVGIDNGGERRADEYSAWENERLGAGGEGEAYIQFLAETLKPHVDSRYRTQAGPKTTGVMGSSMGGLISLHAMINHPDIFGAGGIFSPAFWFAPEIFDAASAIEPRPFSRIYMVTGAQETAEGEPENVYVRDHEAMTQTLLQAGFPQGERLQTHVRADGKHKEWFWRREFPAAVTWLFE